MVKKLVLAALVSLLILDALAPAQQQSTPPQPSEAVPAQPASAETVLDQMDRSAASFRSAQADVTSTQYQKVVDETDVQKGKAYFRRNGKNNLEMVLDITSPDKKYVLLKDDKIRLYQPSIDQVTEYNVAKNRSDVEGMFALGFGGRGHDLLKTFDVKFAGNEMVAGVRAAKLELAPKTDKVRNMFALITLWVDPERGISVQQRFDEPSGDYRLAQYSNIKLNQRISDDVFKLKTTGSTKVVTPQG
jgi:outer membrane lipoprotein-sorting protein